MKDLHLLVKLCNTYTAFITETNKLEPNYKLKDGTPCYGFIPSRDIDFLLRNLKKIYNRLYKKTGHVPSFMDIGCGIGNILLLAHELGYKTTGLEYNPKIYKIATNLCNSKTNIIKGDMRKFKNYGDYDVLYYYHPMMDFKAMRNFSIELCKQMKPGAYLISKGTNELYNNPKGFHLIGKSVNTWRKIK